MKLRVSTAVLRIMTVGALVMPLAATGPARADDAAPDNGAADTAAPDTTAADTTAADGTPAPDTTAIAGTPVPAATPAISPGTYIWTWHHPKGDVLHFHNVSRITAQVPGTDLKLETVINDTANETVTDVAGNGDVTLEQTDEITQITTNGVEQSNSGGGGTTRTIQNKKGIILKTSSEAAGSDSKLTKAMIMASMSPLPDHPVKPGESWTTEIDNQLLPGTKVIMTSTLQRIVSQNGVDLLKIHTKLAIPKDKDGTEIKANTNYNVDPVKGQIISANSTFDNLDLPIGKQTFPVHVEVTQTLIPPAVALQGGLQGEPQGGPAPQPQPTIEDVTAE